MTEDRADAAPPSTAPEPQAAPRKRSGGTRATDAEVADYAAARGFLAAQWFGASLMVASFTLLYALQFGTNASVATTYLISFAALALGTLIFWRSRIYSTRLTLVAPRLHLLVAIVAGSAGIFWLLFAILIALAWAGIPIQ